MKGFKHKVFESVRGKSSRFRVKIQQLLGVEGLLFDLVEVRHPKLQKVPVVMLAHSEDIYVESIQSNGSRVSRGISSGSYVVLLDKDKIIFDDIDLFEIKYYGEAEQEITNYFVSDKLGSGTFGTAYAAYGNEESTAMCEPVAIKCINKAQHKITIDQQVRLFKN